MYIRLHASTRFSCQMLMKIEFSRQILEIYSNIKFIKISPVVSSCSMRTEGQKDRWTDVANIIVAFRNFANATE